MRTVKRSEELQTCNRLGNIYRGRCPGGLEVLETRSTNRWHPNCTWTSAMQGHKYAEAFETGFGATRRFLISRGAPLDDAEEIAQAAWARGWEYREQLRDPGLVSYWVNSIARNLFRARFRSALAVPLDRAHEPSYVFDTDAIDLHRMLDHCSHRDRVLFERT